MTDTLTHDRVDDRELLAAFLRGRDVECSVCQYNLRNSKAEQCPECGAAIRLGVASPLRLRWWIVAFFSAAAAWGFAAVFVAAMSISITRGFWSYIALKKSFMLFGGLLVLTSFTSLLMLQLLRRWPMYRPWGQRLTAAGSILFHAAAVLTAFGLVY